MMSRVVSSFWLLMRNRFLQLTSVHARPIALARLQFSSSTQEAFNNRKLSISRCLKLTKPGHKVAVQGWVRSVRTHKTVSFIEVNDGSSLENLQVVVSDIDISNVSVGASVQVFGSIVAQKRGGVELNAADLTMFGGCDSDYPLQKKYHSLEFLRENLHVRCRTNTIGSMLRVRNAATQGIHKFFQNKEFIQVHAPVITTNDCEGAGELFEITLPQQSAFSAINGDKKSFFGQRAYLTVSGQLHAEMFACGMSKVYSFGPCFRAENSNTTRHLAEFWMVEPEIAFAGLPEAMSSAEECLRATVGPQQFHSVPVPLLTDNFTHSMCYQISHVLDTCSPEIAFFTERAHKASGGGWKGKAAGMHLANVGAVATPRLSS